MQLAGWCLQPLFKQLNLESTHQICLAYVIFNFCLYSRLFLIDADVKVFTCELWGKGACTMGSLSILLLAAAICNLICSLAAETRGSERAFVGLKQSGDEETGVSAHMPSKFIWLLTFQSEQFGPALALAVGTKTLQRHSSINRLKCNFIYLFLIKC